MVARSTSELASSPGLEGVVVARSALSDVDGERGRLVIRGHDIEELAAVATFEQACGLLESGVLPDEAQARLVGDALGRARVWAFEQMRRMTDARRMVGGMDALRASLALLASSGDARTDGRALVGATAVFAAAWARGRQGLPAVAPDASRPHAADCLRMLGGEPAPEAWVRALDTYLVTVSDHGMNASTFAARVIASTGSDTVSAIVGAVGALKGPLHGGAPGPVLDMLDAVGTPDAAVDWLERSLAGGHRIMGMGHRIYRVRDPRAAVLERAVERLEGCGVRTGRLALARAVEAAAEGVLRARYPDRPLRANVEFYTAVLLDAIGIPREAFSAMFAVGRVAGWVSHVEEQRATGRLIRPAAEYVGPMPENPERVVSAAGSARGSASATANVWQPALYASRAAFVHRMAADLVDLLAPRSGERILDVGCGTGELTARIASSGARVVGFDASAEMIEAARAPAPGVTWVQGDAQVLDYDAEFDAVFSNAAIHWMPRAATLASGVKRALVPGGRFVAEFGGHGCIARVREAVGEALVRRGERPAAWMSWYFPTLAEYVAVLSAAGLDVTFAHRFDRPTPVEGDDGLEVWLRTFLPALETALGADWEGFVRDVERAASPVLRCEGGWALDYVRLRVVARRPKSASV